MLKEKIDNELKDALKSKDGIKTSTLRLLKAALKYAEIEKKEELGTFVLGSRPATPQSTIPPE